MCVARHAKGGMQRNYSTAFGWQDDFSHVRPQEECAALRCFMVVSGQSFSFASFQNVRGEGLKPKHQSHTAEEWIVCSGGDHKGKL